MMTLRPLNPHIRRAAQIIITILLLGLLWRGVGGGDALQRLGNANPALLLAALVALMLQTILSARRWQLTSAQLGIILGSGTALREYYLSQIINQALPGGVIGDAGRAVRARGQAGLAAAGKAVMIERLSGQIGLFTVMVLAFLATFMLPIGLDWPAWLLPPVVGLIVGGLLLPVALWQIASRLPGSLGRSLAAFGQAFAKAQASPAVCWRQIGFSLGTALCNIAAFGLCASAVDSSLPLPALLALAPLILFTMVIPVTVSGWGLREGAAATFFPVAGLTANAGLAASIAFGLMMIASTLPGILLIGIHALQSKKQ